MPCSVLTVWIFFLGFIDIITFPVLENEKRSKSERCIIILGGFSNQISMDSVAIDTLE